MTPPSTVTCRACGAGNPAGKRFCGDCGTLIEPSANDVVALIDARLKEKLKDQSVVELQVAQAIAARAIEWAKLFGLFVALPLGILVAVLAVLGVHQYSDFAKMVDSRKQELTEQLKATKSTFDEATQSANTAKSESAKLNGEIAQLRKDVEQTQASELRKSLDLLSSRVAGIERRFKVDTNSVSPELQRTLTQALARFADYLERIGFDTKSAGATVKIDRSAAHNSYYSSVDKSVVVGPDVAAFLDKDPFMATWAYMQHVLTIANRRATDSFGKEPGDSLVNGGALPDYFIASYRNTPKLGEGFPGAEKGYLRNLDNQLKFDKSVTEVHQVGEVWAGAFWKIRALLGQDPADRMFCRMWKSLGRAELTDASGASFARKLLSDVTAVDSSKASAARAILEARGLRF
jgi:phage shock protein A